MEDVNIRTRFREESPPHVASRRGNLEKLLMQQGKRLGCLSINDFSHFCKPRSKKNKRNIKELSRTFMLLILLLFGIDIASSIEERPAEVTGLLNLTNNTETAKQILQPKDSERLDTINEYDEASFDLVKHSPKDAKEILTAIDKMDTQKLKTLLKQLNMKNPIIAYFGTTPATVLHYIAYKGGLEMYREISEPLSDRNPEAKFGPGKGSTPLHRAAQTGHLDILKFIIQYQREINPAEADGVTAMYWAAEEGRMNVVSFYLENLEDKNPGIISTGKFSGRTPLHAAATQGHLNVVKAISKNLSDKNPKDIHGYTPLHAAAFKGHLNVVEYLVDNGAGVNVQTDDFWQRRTALHEAAQGGHLNVVKFLIKHDADPQIMSTHEELKTAYDMAIFKEHCEVAEYLQQFPPFNHKFQAVWGPDDMSNENDMKNSLKNENEKFSECKNSKVRKLKQNEEVEERNLLIISIFTCCIVLIMIFIMIVVATLSRKQHSMSKLDNKLVQTNIKPILSVHK